MQLGSKTPVERCPEPASPEFIEGSRSLVKGVSKPRFCERSAILGLDTALGLDTLVSIRYRYSTQAATQREGLTLDMLVLIRYATQSKRLLRATLDQ
jgi:hypothetical protein